MLCGEESMTTTPELALAETADSSGPLPRRSQEMLEVLRRLVPFDGANTRVDA